jgi:hypothetical protein
MTFVAHSWVGRVRRLFGTASTNAWEPRSILHPIDRKPMVVVRCEALCVRGLRSTGRRQMRVHIVLAQVTGADHLCAVMASVEHG